MKSGWLWFIGAGALLAVHLLDAGAADSKDKPRFKMSPEEKKLLELTNAEREKEDLPPLKPNPTLFEVARSHSRNMAKQGKMEHVLDGKGVKQRLNAAGYDWSWFGENIANGMNQPVAKILEGWMDSKGHRENILRKHYTEIGLGIAEDDNGRKYYTQVFGRPRKKR